MHKYVSSVCAHDHSPIYDKTERKLTQGLVSGANIRHGS
jgi:hypothetical protein